MCQTNLVVIKKGMLGPKRLQVIFESCDFNFHLHNFYTIRNIPEDVRIISPGRGMCDCDSMVGITRSFSLPYDNGHEVLNETELIKYAYEQYEEERFKDEYNWVRLTEKLLDEKVKFGILYFENPWGVKSVNDEDIVEVIGTEQISRDSIVNQGVLRALGENILYWIV